MSTKITTPTILVIVGISGDLARRKLLPAIREIAASESMPDKFKIIGITRRQIDIDEVMPFTGDQTYLRQVLEIRQMDLDNVEDYKNLDVYLKSIETDFGPETQRLFYLSVPPLASQPVIRLMGESGLSKVPHTKLLSEKPFGTDLTSAEDLIRSIHDHFSEDQVYRIDHYLAKEMTQNLVVFRSGNSLFKRTWNKDFIESIVITASQHFGIEGRATFYEQTGALRDIIQSHLLQLAALTLMEIPKGDDWQAIPDSRLRALEKMSLFNNPETSVTRGQYRSYKEEVNNQSSSVETFVSLTIKSSDPVWENVPIVLIAGKGLDNTSTEIKISYKRDEVGESNTLILRIQPNEGVELQLWAKEPGYERKLRQLPLTFSYSEHFADVPEAYERVFVDAMKGDRSLFTGSEEVLASWRVLSPVQEYWQSVGGDGLVIYESGSKANEITDNSSQ